MESDFAFASYAIYGDCQRLKAADCGPGVTLISTHVCSEMGDWAENLGHLFRRPESKRARLRGVWVSQGRISYDSNLNITTVFSGRRFATIMGAIGADPDSSQQPEPDRATGPGQGTAARGIEGRRSSAPVDDPEVRLRPRPVRHPAGEADLPGRDSRSLQFDRPGDQGSGQLRAERQARRSGPDQVSPASTIWSESAGEFPQPAGPRIRYGSCPDRRGSGRCHLTRGAPGRDRLRNGGRIVSIEADGSDRRVLTRKNGPVVAERSWDAFIPVEDSRPSISPDGTMLLFQRDRDLKGLNRSSSIVVANRDGSGQKEIATWKNAGVTWLAWSPDNRVLVGR